jgi:hypothetical protein
MFISKENAEKDNGAINVLTKNEFQSLKDLFCSDSVSINVISKSSFLCMKALESKSIEYKALNCNHIHSVNLSERIFINYYINNYPNNFYRYYIINSPSNGSAPPPAKDQGNDYSFITLSNNNFNRDLNASINIIKVGIGNCHDSKYTLREFKTTSVANLIEESRITVALTQ